MAADSVGLKTPDQMPPNSITGKVSGKAARQSTKGISDQEMDFPKGRLRWRAMKAIHSIKLAAINKPGTTPAKNRAPKEAVLMRA